jgi:hypothetical protein
MSGRTYLKAKAVVKAGEQNPDKSAPLVERMDRTGSVDASYNTLLEQTGRKPASRRQLREV